MCVCLCVCVCVCVCVCACMQDHRIVSLLIYHSDCCGFIPLVLVFSTCIWWCPRKIKTKKIPFCTLGRQTVTEVTQYLFSRFARRFPSSTQSQWLQNNSGPPEGPSQPSDSVDDLNHQGNRGAESTEVLQTRLFEMHPYPRSFREENRRNHSR